MVGQIGQCCGGGDAWLHVGRGREYNMDIDGRGMGLACLGRGQHGCKVKSRG